MQTDAYGQMQSLQEGLVQRNSGRDDDLIEEDEDPRDVDELHLNYWGDRDTLL